MRKALLAGAVLGLALGMHGVAAADDHDVWFLGVVPSDQSREYIDAIGYSQVGPYWYARIVNVMPDDSHGFVVLASDVEIDCAGSSYQYQDGKSYDRQGKVLQAAVPRPTTWTPTSTEFGTSQIQTFICEDGSDHPGFQRASDAAAALPGAIYADWSAVPPSTWTGGWSFAKWGMTRPEVEAAGKGVIHLAPDDGMENVDGEVDYGPYKFNIEVEFNGDTDRSQLTEIIFSPLGWPASDCPNLKRYLQQNETFGSAEKDTPNNKWSTVGWLDTKAGNQVLLEDMRGDDCEVQFYPLGTISG
jgi:hypothetical protein